MHIGIITSEFPPDFGGVETYAIEYAKALLKAGADVSVFVHSGHPVDETLDNLNIYPVLKFSRRIDRGTLRQYDVDAWHAMNASHSWIALETSKPVVVSIHGNDFLDPYPLTGNPRLSQSRKFWRFSALIKKIENRFARRWTFDLIKQSLPACRVILSNSQFTKNVFLENYPGCKDKTLVAQVGVSEDFLQQPLKVVNNKPLRLLSISRLSEQRKNIDRVIEALAALKPKFGFHYTVIGDGEYLPELRRKVDGLGLQEEVLFLGRQSTDCIIEKLGSADLFILTSSTLPDSHEGFGIVYLEAAALGTPSLATRQAGAVEAVSDGNSGFFVDEPTVANIQQALEKFLNGELTFDRQQCRAFAQEFTWKRVVARALPYYGEG